MNLVITAYFISHLTLTAYQSVPEQTDSSPYWTASGERVNSSGVAISRDLHARWGGPLNFGDTLYIEGVGIKIVNDVMADTRCVQRDANKKCIKREPQRKWIDVWVPSQQSEANFHRTFKNKKWKVWLVEKKR